MNLCIEKIVALIEQGRDDRRSVFQLGYNLGRLGELTGLGRGPFWDRWKDAVESWDLPKLRQLAHGLPSFAPSLNESEETQAGAIPPASGSE